MHSALRRHRLMVRALAVGATVFGIAAAVFTGASATSAASHFSAPSVTSVHTNLWHDM